MINICRNICNFIKSSFRNSRAITELNTYKPCYRVADIDTSVTNEPSVTIQMIGKSITFKIAPEALLADDKLVNCFSPTDIRTLTYLGYLGINSPKYKILAKTLSEKNDQVLFALRKKGEEGLTVATADEISKNKEILKELTQEEAHMIGLTSANEQTLIEKSKKEALLREITSNTEECNQTTSPEIKR